MLVTSSEGAGLQAVGGEGDGCSNRLAFNTKRANFFLTLTLPCSATGEAATAA